MTLTLLTVSLIIHEDYSHIEAALHSFYAETKTPAEIYLTINTGQDPRIKSLRQQFPDVHILINDRPQGFAANHNQIMRLAKTEFAALLNDDIVLHEGAIDMLVNYLQAHPDVGLVGPALLNADSTPQVSAYSDPSLLRTLYRLSGLASLTHQQSMIRRWLTKMGITRLLNVESLKTNGGTRTVPVVKGVAMVVRRAAYQQAGLMDEITRAYGEEYGWHLRLRRAGWKLILVEEAKVTHYGLGQARLNLGGWLLTEDRKAMLSYYQLYRPAWQAWIVRGAILIMHSLYALGLLFFNRQRAKAHADVVKMALRFSVHPKQGSEAK